MYIMVNSIQERSKDLINMKNVNKSILKREEQPSFAEKWNQDSCILKKSWRKPLLCIQKISSPPFRPLYSALLYNIMAGLMKWQAREVVFILKVFDNNDNRWKMERLVISGLGKDLMSLKDRKDNTKWQLEYNTKSKVISVLSRKCIMVIRMSMYLYWFENCSNIWNTDVLFFVRIGGTYFKLGMIPCILLTTLFILHYTAY